MLAYTFYESDNRVRRYAETLARRGDEVEAIVLRREGQRPRDLVGGVRVRRIQRRVRNEVHPIAYLAKLLAFFLLSAWHVTLAHLRKPYAVIHVHSVPDFEVFATMIPRLLGARVILDIHDIVPELYASKFKISEQSVVFRLLVLLERLSIAYCDHVIIANHLWQTKLLGRSTKPEKCTVILNYPDPAIFFARKRAERDGREFLLCYPGTLNSHQGVDRVVSAVALLRERAPNLKFLVMGDGPDLGKLRRMVKANGLEDRVAFAGSVPIEEVAATMATVDLGVVPKRSDSFGNEAFSTKILEFMAMCVPVLASSTRIDRYYFNERIVQFFDSGSVTDLAEKILELMNSRERRETLSRNAGKFIQANNWSVKASEYLDLLDRLVTRGMPAGRVPGNGTLDCQN